MYHAQISVFLKFLQLFSYKILFTPNNLILDMTRRIYNSNNFSQPTRFLTSNSLKRKGICQSRQLMHEIINVKMQLEYESKCIKALMSKNFVLEKDDAHSKSINQDDSFNSSSVSSHEPPYVKERSINNKYLMNLIKEEEIQEQQKRRKYPELFKKIEQRILQKAQELKNKIKKKKGLNIDQKFLPINNHKCEFCGKLFEKPCSLGGHISKLHQEQKKRRKQNEQQMVKIEFGEIVGNMK